MAGYVHYILPGKMSEVRNWHSCIDWPRITMWKWRVMMSSFPSLTTTALPEICMNLAWRPHGWNPLPIQWCLLPTRIRAFILQPLLEWVPCSIIKRAICIPQRGCTWWPRWRACRLYTITTALASSPSIRSSWIQCMAWTRTHSHHMRQAHSCTATPDMMSWMILSMTLL